MGLTGTSSASTVSWVTVVPLLPSPSVWDHFDSSSSLTLSFDLCRTEVWSFLFSGGTFDYEMGFVSLMCDEKRFLRSPYSVLSCSYWLKSVGLGVSFRFGSLVETFSLIS